MNSNTEIGIIWCANHIIHDQVVTYHPAQDPGFSMTNDMILTNSIIPTGQVNTICTGIWCFIDAIFSAEKITSDIGFWSAIFDLDSYWINIAAVNLNFDFSS